MPDILCIEDEPDLREDLIEELNEAGYETIEAGNGVDGLKLILDHRPDLVLCDVNLPGISGPQLLAELKRNHPDCADIPFFFLSALAERDSSSPVADIHPDNWFLKPINYDSLLPAIEACLEERSRPEIRNDRDGGAA